MIRRLKLLGLVTVAVLAVSPARGPEPGTGATGEAAGELAAIPASQEDVDSVGVSTNSTTFVDIPNSVVNIDNGTSARKVVVTFSAEVTFTDTDTFLLGFRIDSGSCAFGGPQTFSQNTFLETRTAVHVFRIGAGTHTIRPCWAKVDDGDGLGLIVVARRSLIAEGRTQ